MEAIRQRTAQDSSKKRLSDAQRERYGTAIAALEHLELGGDPKLFGGALRAAIYYCEKARAFDWPERRFRKRRSKVASSWGAANAAADKLAIHFEQLDDRVGSARLHAAILKSGLQMKSQGTLHVSFAKLLRALAKQPKPRSHQEQIGPLKIQISGRKLPSRENVLIILLAHLFDRVAGHHGDGALKIAVGEPISHGRAWDVAAKFVAATFASDGADAGAARKFLHDHSGQLLYAGWPPSGTG
jgi:hypothetical protein